MDRKLDERHKIVVDSAICSLFTNDGPVEWRMREKIYTFFSSFFFSLVLWQFFRLPAVNSNGAPSTGIKK